MEVKYLIGCDIGTQGTKTVLFDIDGRALADAFEPSNLISPTPGTVEQDPDEIYGSVIRTVRAVIERSGVKSEEIGGLSIDGQMSGIMGIGADFEAVTPYDSWLDTRCSPYVDKIKSTALTLSESLTGCPVTAAHGAKILRWKTEFPEVYKRIKKFVLPSVYVAGRLCALKSDQAFIDYTNIHFSGFADNKNKCWSDELLDIFGVEKSKMPDIVSPTKIIGSISARAAAESGLCEGMPVAAGCGDQAASSLGAGVSQKGDCFDVAGTASVFSCCTDVYSPDLENRTILYARHVIDGLWQPMAYISGGGLCVKWAKESLLMDKFSYAELEAQADKLPAGTDGLLFIPHFAGRTCPSDLSVRGMFANLSWNHDGAAMFKAVMESIAYEYKMYLDILRKNGAASDITAVCAIGGGAKSACFNQIKADVLGIDYSVSDLRDTAPYGAALVAGAAIGIYGDLAKAAKRRITGTVTVSPNKERHVQYEKYAQEYADLLESLSSKR